MKLDIFGFEIKSKKEKERNSVVPPSQMNGGALEVYSFNNLHHTGFTYDSTGKINSQKSLISKYRAVSQYPEVDEAIQDIVNEAIVYDSDHTNIVEIILDNIDEEFDSKQIKSAIQKEFNNVLRLLDFNNAAYDIFWRFYIDGQINYNIILNNASSKGISELRYIDAKHIQKVRLIQHKPGENGVPIVGDVEEYYIYKNDEKDGKQSTNQEIRLSKDSVCHVNSGIYSPEDGNLIYSHLHKALRLINQLRNMEDSLVIYRVTRAPERRIFYIDTAGLPPKKAKQYLEGIKNGFSSRQVYNPESGTIDSKVNQNAMIEDFWLPRSSNGRGTEISTLQGGQNLGELGDVEYFRNRVYRSLNVPTSRIEGSENPLLARTSEITRDELKFQKFINRLRLKFNALFNELLKIQLVSKKIMNLNEWDRLKRGIRYDYNRDSHFTEVKDSEILRDRIDMMQSLGVNPSEFFSKEWVYKNILKFNDKEIEDMQEQKEKEEKENPDEMPFINQDQEPIEQEPKKEVDNNEEPRDEEPDNTDSE